MESSGQTLKLRQTILTETSKLACTVDQFIGGGGQGEVYKATLAGKPVAVKWYFKQNATREQRIALDILIKRGVTGDLGKKETAVARLRRGQSFGEVALVDEGLRSASAPRRSRGRS